MTDQIRERFLWLHESINKLIDENGELRNKLTLAYTEREDREITLNKVIEERDLLKKQLADEQGRSMRLVTQLNKANFHLKQLWFNIATTPFGQ